MDSAFEYVALQQCLVLGAATGAVGPDIASGIARIDHPPHLAIIAVSGRIDGRFADKAEAPIDADVRIVAEHGRCDLRQRYSVGMIPELAPDLQRPARIDILLVRLARLQRQICLADLPALIAAFSSLVLRCLGAATAWHRRSAPW